MGPRAEQGALPGSGVVCEKTPLLGDAPVAVLLPLDDPAPDPADKLSAKELVEFVGDPFWRTLRAALFFGYWVVLFGLLVASLSLSVAHCGSPLPHAPHFPAPAPALPPSPASLLSVHASLAPKPA